MSKLIEFDNDEIERNFLNILRTHISQFDPRTRVTEKTNTYSLEATTSKFDLGKTLSYIKSVSKNAVVLKEYADYTIHWGGTDIGKVELTVAAEDGDTVVIVWGDVTGGGNFIYGDLPRTDISKDTQPRIGFQFTYSSSFAGQSGGTGYALFHEILIQFRIVARTVPECNLLTKQLSSFIKKNAKIFPFFRFLQPQSISEGNNFSDNTSQSYAKSLAYVANQKIEQVTYT